MKKTDVGNTSTSESVQPNFVLQWVFACLFVVSVILATLGVSYMVSSGYTPNASVPVYYVLFNVTVLGGSAMMLQSLLKFIILLSTLGCTSKTAGSVATSTFVFVWGTALLVFGLLRFGGHPFRLGDCPCPAFHAKIDGECVACPGWQEGVCEEAGCVCGEGGVCSEKTATCQCNINWQIDPANQTCTVCSDRTRDSAEGQCTRCRSRFLPDDDGLCNRCAPGYIGADCMVCGDQFQPALDDDGSIILNEDGSQVCGPVRGCKDDAEPGSGRVGKYCDLVKENCRAHGDINAKVKVTNNDLPLPFTFTFDGNACAYHDDCDSYNCQGLCSLDSVTANALCYEDEDCPGGTCGGRVCALEYRVAEDVCECSIAGYQYPRCEKCPGFTGGSSATICGGRGTCVSVYVDPNANGGPLTEYKELQCMCGRPKGQLDEWPRFGGDFCEKIVTQANEVVGCAENFFGDLCERTCPGSDGAEWGGIASCNARGRCEDQGDKAVCVCDADTAEEGIGYFGSDDCSTCFDDNFYGGNCQPCPALLKLTGVDECLNQDIKITLDPTTCFTSCTKEKPKCDTREGFCFKV